MHGPHDADTPRHRAAAVLVLIGDSVHNLMGGVVIAAFLASVPLRVVTSFAVAAHEIPRSLGNTVILAHSGLSRGRALLNLATGWLRRPASSTSPWPTPAECGIDAAAALMAAQTRQRCSLRTSYLIDLIKELSRTCPDDRPFLVWRERFA